VSKLIAHTIHPEAIPRRQSYIKIARVEERKKAREKLHQMLIEAFDSTNAPKKRRSEEAGFEIQEQHSKKMKSLEDLNNGNISVSISEFEFNGIWQSPVLYWLPSLTYHRGNKRSFANEPATFRPFCTTNVRVRRAGPRR
jgi:hypothetical protein